MAHHLVLSVAIVALALLAPCAAVYPWPVCGNSGNYAANSNYLANINSIGATPTLAENASTSPDLFATAQVGAVTEQFWALALCRGDTSASYCLSCLERAFQDLPNACPYNKDATIYYDSCLLHYTNIPFGSTNDTAYSRTYRLRNNLNATAEPARFQRFVAALVNATAYYAAYNSTRLFASGEADFDQELPKVYSWAQCTPDMTPARCRDCLVRIMESLPRLFTDSIGARVLGIRCSYRYETKPFYDGPVMVQLPATSNSSGAPTPAPAGEGSKRTDTKTILIVLTSAAATLLFPCIYVLIWHRKGKILHFLLCKRTSSSAERNYEAMIVSYGSLAPKRYMYSEVMKITSSRNNQLGKGGYGVVFKGRLHDGRLVAVKFLHDCKGNGDKFLNEVMSIGRTSHVNIVSLFGFCLDGSKRALIYEYMSNGSLDRYIYSKNPKEILGWERLYAIAISIARGLEYLHHSCNTRIVHFDIKPQNILLDQDFCPKIADFGLAKLCRTKESMLSMTGARGTIGFIAPEVHSRTFGVVSTKADVYSYGMMLLEMVGGRRNVKPMAENSSEKYFPDWIYDHFAQDDGLQACEVTSELAEIARKMTLIGLWCIQVLPMYRPTITKVLEMFERSLDELDMPPKQNFCELLEDSTNNMTVQSASSTSPGKAQEVLSEVIQVEETSLVNSKILKHLPTL